MKKKAVIINGISGRVSDNHILVKLFEKHDYETKYVETLDESVDVENINLDKDVDVIVGFSFGGMVVLKLANKYPRAKIVLVATGARGEFANPLLEMLYKLIQNDFCLTLLIKLINLPEKWLAAIYKMISPCKDESLKEIYDEDMKMNIEFLRGIKIDKWRSILRFVKKNDLAAMAAKIKNECLIISGINDVIMPLNLGVELHRLIKRSQFKITQGSHFNVIDENNVGMVKEFAEEKEKLKMSVLL